MPDASTNLQILLTAQDQASAVIAGANKSVASLGDQISAAGKTMTVAGGIITAGFAFAVKAAADADVTLGKVNATLTAMGKNTPGVKDAILKAAEATQKLGFDNEDAALSITKLYQRTGDMSEAIKLNSLAMDLARAKNLDLVTAGNLVGMVMSGNGRVLKQYGVDLKSAGSPAEALIELQGKLSGQAVTFSQTFTGQSQVMQQQINDLTKRIGNDLIPVLTSLLQAVTPVIESVIAWTGAHPALTKAIVVVVAALGAFMAVVGPMLLILPALGAAITALTGPVGLVIVAIGLLVAAGVAVYENWDVIKAKAAEIWGAIGAYLQKALDAIDKAFRDTWTGLAGFFNGIWEGIKSTLKSAINWILDQLNTVTGAANTVISVVNKVPGVNVSKIPSVPHLAEGGIVSSPTLALIGEAGPEAVVPLSGGGGFGAGLTINISGNTILAADANGAARIIGNLILKQLQASHRI